MYGLDWDTDSKEKEKEDLDKTLASRLSPPEIPDSGSEELKSNSDSTDSVESDSGSLPNSELLDR